MNKIFIRLFCLILSAPLCYAQEQTDFVVVPASKTLHRSIKELPFDVQLYTLQFLIKFDTKKDPVTGDLIIIPDAKWQLKRLQQIKQPIDLHIEYIKDILRSEYCYRSIFTETQTDLTHKKTLKPSSLCSDILLFGALNYIYDCDSNKAQDYLEIGALLIANGALVHQTKNDVFQALYKAAKHNSIPVVQLLRNAGVSKSNTSITNKNQLDSALHVAAKHNSLDVIVYLSSLGENLNDQNRSGQTALHKASQYRHQESVDLLLQLGADRTIKNNYGQTYLTIPKIKK